MPMLLMNYAITSQSWSNVLTCEHVENFHLLMHCSWQTEVAAGQLNRVALTIYYCSNSVKRLIYLVVVNKDVLLPLFA